jgi:CRP/FNR family transcriptional regulator, cyclic AMP receptor protein
MVPHSPEWQRVRSLLAKNSFLGRLPDGVLDALMRKGKIRRHVRGDIIFRRGEPGDSLLVLTSGQAKLTNISPTAREVVMQFVGVGDVFGETSALDGKERAVTAVAQEDLEVFIIHSRDLLPTLTAHPGAMLAVVHALCETIRFGAAVIEDNTLEMRGRMARGLLRLARQHGRAEEDGVSLALTISQEDLGKHLDLSRANVSRQLGHLKTAGVIKIDGAQITLVDADELAAIGEMTPARDTRKAG